MRESPAGPLSHRLHRRDLAHSLSGLADGRARQASPAASHWRRTHAIGFNARVSRFSAQKATPPRRRTRNGRVVGLTANHQSLASPTLHGVPGTIWLNPLDVRRANRSSSGNDAHIARLPDDGTAAVKERCLTTRRRLENQTRGAGRDRRAREIRQSAEHSPSAAVSYSYIPVGCGVNAPIIRPGCNPFNRLGRIYFVPTPGSGEERSPAMVCAGDWHRDRGRACVPQVHMLGWHSIA